MREPRAQLLDISARRGRRCVPSAVAAGQVALSRRRGAISCFHFYFLKPPSNPSTHPPNHSKERSSITFERSCQMHIVFLRILFVLAASFLAAISLANSWGMFVQHRLGPCDLISSSRPYNVNNNPWVFFSGPVVLTNSQDFPNLSPPPSSSGVTQVMTFPTTVIPGREK